MLFVTQRLLRAKPFCVGTQTVNLFKNLFIVLNVLELVVSTQDTTSVIVDHIHMKHIHIYCIENIIT